MAKMKAAPPKKAAAAAAATNTAPAKKTEKTEKATQAAAPAKKASAKAAKSKVENKVGQKINKSDIVNLMYEKSQSTDGEVKMTKTELNAAVNYFMDVVTEQMATGATILMTGFLKIKPSYRGPRTANNIINNEPMEIPESISPIASVGVRIKDYMRDNMPAEVFDGIKGE